MQNATKILKWEDHSFCIDMAENFLENIKLPVFETISTTDEESIKDYLKKIKDDLNLNWEATIFLGTGVSFFIPIVKNLIEKGNINVELSFENLILLVVTTLSILYIEYKKGELSKTEEGLLKKDSRSLLFELRLKGIGQGIVKKLKDIFFEILSTFSRSFGLVTKGLLDVLGYTSILVPFMNAVRFLVDKYDLTLDNFVGNFISLGVGLSAIISKNGIDWLLKKFRKNLSPDSVDPLGDKDTSDDIKMIKDQMKQM